VYNRDVLVVAKHNPELDQSQDADPSDGEQANPLNADSHAQAEAGHGKPEPPTQTKCARGAKLLLVGEGGEGKGSESGRDHQGRIEEDQASLGEESVLCSAS
jgi:hypothetical protein